MLIDVGCGPTGVINYVDGEIKIGVDSLANNYKKYFDIPPETQLIRAIGEKLPFRDRIADLVFCINVLDHTKSPEEVVMEIHRILRNDGILILQVNTRALTRKGTYDVYHPHYFTAKNVERMLQRTGFNNLKCLYDKPSEFKMFALKLFIGSIIRRVGFIFSKSTFTTSVKIAARVTKAPTSDRNKSSSRS